MNSSELNSKIVTLLKSIYDPEIPINIWDLGLIYGIVVKDEGRVDIVMTLTSPNCPVIDILPRQVEEVVESLPEVREAFVDLTWNPPWDKSMISEEGRFELGI